jgi:hypothetical protein
VLAFQPPWRAAVLAGTKTTTVRTRRYGSPGDAFVVEGARFELTAVTAMTLAAARDLCWASEGFASADDFERAWAANHPTRGWRPGDQVWVHRFRHT